MGQQEFIRGIDVYYDDNYKEAPDITIDVWVPWRDIDSFMSHFYPWLDFELVESRETMSAEVEVHLLEVYINELGQQFLGVEDFIEEGVAEQDEE